MLYVYALAEDLAGVQDLSGVRGEPLVIVPLAAAVAIAGEMTGKPAIEAATLKSQDTLVRELHTRAAALLPMRFGTTATDAADLRRALDARAGLIDRLHAVRDCEQMIVRVFGPAIDSPADVAALPAAPGHRYLASRRPHVSTALSAIAAGAGGLARDVRVEPAQQAGLHGSVYHLIERGRADAYRAAITRAAGAQEIHVVVTGPSPPYAFA